MGEPILEPGKIPVALAGLVEPRVVNVPLAPHVKLEDTAGWSAAVGLDARLTCVSMGNPHVMLYCRDVAAVPLAAVGPVLERHAIFPRRINVHFVQVQSPREVTMRTWERGSGITLACGTGASAVCVAGVLTGYTERKLLAHLPGGDLELEWAADNHVYMTGPATEVFSGEWP
jgi:diaminopimelate epimerase